MKEIEKYIGYYLLVYLVVLALCGFFQYISVCQGKSLLCAVSMNGINTIVTTTAYVLTPIVVIFGFFTWKVQYKYQLNKERSAKVFELALQLNSELKILRGLDFNIRTRIKDENVFDYIHLYLDKKYEWYLEKILNLEQLYEKVLNEITILEYSIDNEMGALKKIVVEHQHIFEMCRHYFLVLLKRYEQKHPNSTHQENLKYNRELYQYLSSRYEVKIYEDTKIYHPKEAEIFFESTQTQRIIGLTEKLYMCISEYQK